MHDTRRMYRFVRQLSTFLILHTSSSALSGSSSYRFISSTPPLSVSTLMFISYTHQFGSMAGFPSPIFPLFQSSFSVGNRARRMSGRYSKHRCNSLIPNGDMRRTPTPQLSASMNDLSQVERIFAISDLHVDNTSNRIWLTNRCTFHPTTNRTTDSTNHTIPGPNDVLILAGDISHEISTLKETFSILQEGLQCHIFFVPGNHEGWIGGDEMESLRIHNSLDKLSAIDQLCAEMGIHTNPCLVGDKNTSPVWILPIESWYDGSLSLEGCEDLCHGFSKWPWVDFVRCVWPPEFMPHLNNQNQTSSTFRATENHRHHSSRSYSESRQEDVADEVRQGQKWDQNMGKIPKGLTEFFLKKNEAGIHRISTFYKNFNKHSKLKSIPPGLISFSHFLPNRQSLPDWKDVRSERFLRTQWLTHPVPEVSAMFAKVAGSALIDQQIRSIVPHSMMCTSEFSNASLSSTQQLPNLVRHIHVFGHSHRPKDFRFDGIRYIHNPLGKPSEREMNLISEDVHFQLIWDCRNKVSGEILGETVIRYWEENGGIRNIHKMAKLRSGKKNM